MVNMLGWKGNDCMRRKLCFSAGHGEDVRVPSEAVTSENGVPPTLY